MIKKQPTGNIFSDPMAFFREKKEADLERKQKKIKEKKYYRMTAEEKHKVEIIKEEYSDVIGETLWHNHIEESMIIQRKNEPYFDDGFMIELFCGGVDICGDPEPHEYTYKEFNEIMQRLARVKECMDKIKVVNPKLVEGD